MNMRLEYTFALGFLVLVVFNLLRSLWFWRKKQRIMLAVSLCFLGVALVAAAYMGYQGWQAQQREQEEAAQVAPPADGQK